MTVVKQTARQSGVALVVTTILAAGGCTTPKRPAAPIEDHNAPAVVSGPAVGYPPAASAAAPANTPVPDTLIAQGIADPGTSLVAEALAPPTPSPPAAPTTNPAVDALIERGRDALAGGDAGAAEAVLQRALSIDGADARVWHWLAQANLALGNLDQARTMAERCNSLAAEAATLRGENWLLLARIEDRAGSPELAARARRRAADYLP